MRETVSKANQTGKTTNFLLFTGILFLIWTLLMAGSLVWNHYSERAEAVERAIQTARTEFSRDLLYRQWNASHSGVYVKVTPESPPNPFLAFRHDRDLMVITGDTLTLMNPAFMTREVHELGRLNTGMSGHITSLEPIRPMNAPDPWESQALQRFELGEEEVIEVDTIQGEAYLRFMRHLVTEASCLECHGHQGYKVGDIRGGISVNILMAPHYAITRSRMVPLIYGHAGVWLLGLAGIGLFVRNLRSREEETQRISEERLAIERKTLAAQKMESLGLMASGVAHDFNNKLSVILGNIELANMELPKDEIPSQEMREIEKAALESAKLTKQLLGFAREQPVVPKLVDMNDLANESLRMIRRLLPENIDLSWIPADDPMLIKIDPVQFDQIMTNLVLNARDAVGESGRIEVSTEEVVLTEPLNSGMLGVPAGRYRMLTVSDNGIGISEELLDSIFEPFFTTKPIGKGTGLGLPMVYGIVKQNKGQIRVETELGEGVRVNVYFPPVTEMMQHNL